jgi:hypothetical protein
MLGEETASEVPFTRDSELYDLLDTLSNHEAQTKTPMISNSIEQMNGKKVTVPGEPWLEYDLESSEHRSFILDELLTPGLDKLSPYLWLTSTPRSDHISSLHQQCVKGRQITIAENPELHLTWMHNHVYIKPIPECLLSWHFWNSCLAPSSDVSPLSKEERELAKASAVGFLRSYSFMILHASDYRIAVEHGLVSRQISYEKLRRFLGNFRKIQDSEASKRYHYGELRLRRVNFWARFFLRRFIFQKVQVHYNYNAYFARFYGPMIFIFAFFSTTLSAMQVELASNSNLVSLSPNLLTFVSVCKWYSICTVIVATTLLVGLLLLLSYMMLRESIYALRFVFGKRRVAAKKGSASEGV